MTNNESNPPSGLVYNSALHSFSVFLAIWALLIVVVGATVKSHEAGLSIPDGFIYHWIPDWFNRPNLKYEFFHRLLVPVLGFGTLTMVIWTFCVETRKNVRIASALVLVLLLCQAFIGYLTVAMYAHAQTSIPHAALGQSILALLASLATVRSQKWMSATPAVTETDPTPLRKLARANVIAVFIQLLLGAALRHDDHGKALVEGREWVFYSHLAAHVLGAVAVSYFMARVIMRVFRNHRSELLLLKPTRYIMMLLGVQLMLGTGAAIFKILFAEDGNNPPPIRAWTATAHVAVGAMILLFSVLLMVRSYRYVSPAPVSPGASEAQADAPVTGVTA